METKKENVNMKPSGNRVVDAMVLWAAEEVKMKETFGANVVSKQHFAKVKYHHYVDLLNKYGKTKDPSEARYLNILKGEMNEIKKIAIPNKYVRFANDVQDLIKVSVVVVLNALKSIHNAGKQIVNAVVAYNERKKDDAIQKLIAKERERTIKIAMYDNAVKDVTKKNVQQTVVRNSRRNGMEKVRGQVISFDDDGPLLPKKKAKGKSVPGDEDVLLPKRRDSTGKGVKI
ncbi:MAG: hypothetical protein ABI675_03060 [Chitinophagaceae bacterium]